MTPWYGSSLTSGDFCNTIDSLHKKPVIKGFGIISFVSLDKLLTKKQNKTKKNPEFVCPQFETPWRRRHILEVDDDQTVFVAACQ